MREFQRWAASQQDLSPITKSVLNILAAMANKSGECFPSVRFLASACCISERTVQRSLADLKAKGLLTARARATASHGQTSNLYRLIVPKTLTQQASCATLPDLPLASPPASLDTPPGDSLVTQNSASIKALTHHQHPQVVVGDTDRNLIFPDGLGPLERTALGNLLGSVGIDIAQILLDEIGGRLRAHPPILNTISYMRALIKRSLDGTFVPEHAENERDRRWRMNRKRQDELAKTLAPHIASPPGPEIKARLSTTRAAIIAKVKGA